MYSHMKTLLGLLALLGAAGVNGRPNFIVFMADDLAYGDLGFTGNKDVETPNIDSLARESVYFPNFYVAPVCAPTRASLLTGRHALKTGVWGVHGGRDYLNLDESTFANVLSNAGYATALFGKWHNGKTDGYHSWDRGFHEACETELYNYYDNIAKCNGKDAYTKGWVAHNIAHWAKDFMTRKTREGHNFVLYVPFMAPHLGRFGGGWGEYWYSPQHIEQKYLNKGLSDGLAKLYGSVEMMDRTVGDILNHLDSLGKGSDTVVMFFTDNGGTGKEKMWDYWRRNHLGLRGEKGQVSENGIRSPLFVRWRGSFPSGATAHSQLAVVEDIFPTMMELAGTGHGNKPVDGRSLVSVLYNPWEDHGFSQRTLYHTLMAPRWTYSWGQYKPLPNFGTDKSGLTFGREGEWALREGLWKYVNQDGYEYLFNIKSDPKEHHHVWDWTTIKRLRDKMFNWWQSIVWDGGAFTPPAFYIGYPGHSNGMILGNGVASASDQWSIRTHDVSGTVGGGQYLQYKVIVAAAGGYHIKIHSGNSFQGELEFKVRCWDSETAVRGKIQWDGYVGWLNIPQTGSSCVLTVTVVSGYGWLWFDHFWFERSGSGGVHSG